MFTELDATTGPLSKIVSAPLDAMPFLFGAMPKSGINAATVVTTMARQVLTDTRLTDEALRRRFNLLAESIDAGTDGGYLAGYLSVKHLWLGSVLNSGDDLLLSESAFLRASYACGSTEIMALFTQF